VSWYRANAYIKQNKIQLALIDFEKAYNQNPYNHFVLNDLGSAYYVVGQLDNAKLYFEKSIKINPRFDDPKLNLAAIYINEGNFTEAEKRCKSLLHDSERRTYYEEIINKNKMVTH
jgi:tetratricopeptide (TPR) repeat protein